MNDPDLRSARLSPRPVPAQGVVRAVADGRRRRGRALTGGAGALVLVTVLAGAALLVPDETGDVLQPAAVSPAPSTGVDPAALLARRFQAVERTRAGRAWPLLEGTSLSLDFAADPQHMTFFAGCNVYGTNLDITPTRLLGAQPSSNTLALCHGAAQRQNDDVSAFFEAGPAWQLDGDVLSLSAGDVSIVLRSEVGGPSPGVSSTSPPQPAAGGG